MPPYSGLILAKGATKKNVLLRNGSLRVGNLLLLSTKPITVELGLQFTTGACLPNVDATGCGYIHSYNINPLKCSGVKQLHLKVFSAIQI